jgi:hypothetical protein
MAKIRKAFFNWFSLLMIFFVLANLAGLIRPKGLLPFRAIGFPIPFKAWGGGVDESFEWRAFVEDTVLALLGSGALGWGCAWARSRRNTGSSKMSVAPGD